MLNIFSDNQQSALKYLKNTEVTLQNILIITRDFNIRDSIWDLSYPFHLIYSFFLNQQFITQGMMADHGSYFCNYLQ